jgi:hypothetical protein
MDRRITDSPGKGGSKKALLEARDLAMQDEVDRRAAEGDGPNTTRRRIRFLHAAFLVTVLFGSYILVAKPAWFVTPPPPPEPPALQEASLRIAMWQLALYVERYRSQHETLPATLEQAGAPPVSGLAYQRVGRDEYLITGSNGLIDLSLRDGDALDEFVGNSLEIVAARGKP